MEDKNEVGAFGFRFVNGIGVYSGLDTYPDRTIFYVRILFLEFSWHKIYMDDNDMDDFLNGATGGI